MDQPFTIDTVGSVATAVFRPGIERARPELCILLGGSGTLGPDAVAGDTRVLYDLAHGLSECGYSSLRCGKPRGIPFSSLSYKEEYFDPVLKAVSEIRTKHSEIRRVVIVGHSLGGHVAPHLALRCDDVIGIATLNAHFSPLEKVFEWQANKYSAGPNEECLLTFRDFKLLRIWHKFYMERNCEYNLSNTLQKGAFNLLNLVGTRDTLIANDEQEKWKARVLECPNIRATFETLEGLNHFMVDEPINYFMSGKFQKVSRAVLEKLEEWLSTLPIDSTHHHL